MGKHRRSDSLKSRVDRYGDPCHHVLMAGLSDVDFGGQKNDFGQVKHTYHIFNSFDISIQLHLVAEPCRISIWRFPKLRDPQVTIGFNTSWSNLDDLEGRHHGSPQIIQVMDDHVSIETYGDRSFDTYLSIISSSLVCLKPIISLIVCLKHLKTYNVHLYIS